MYAIIEIRWQFIYAYRALVVGAVGLRLSEEGQEAPHCHFMVEDAFARVEAATVRHLEGFFDKNE